MNPRTCIRSLIVAVLFAPGTYAASINIFQMSMLTKVYVDGDQDADRILTPTNPLNTTHHAQLGMTEATTVLDLAWSPTGGRFDFLFDHVIDDSDDLAATTSVGNIGITSDVDLWLEYEYTYSYSNLNGDIGITSLNQVQQATGNGSTNLVRTLQNGGAGWLRPPSGTLTFDFQVLLEAGELYGINFDTTLDAFEENGAIGTGTGSLSITLTPVPEPSTAAPLALLVSLAIHQRRRPSPRLLTTTPARIN